MLKRPARNAIATPRPAKRSGVACTSVSATPCAEPRPPCSNAPYAANGFDRNTSMIAAPAMSASSVAIAGPRMRRSHSRTGGDASHQPPKRGIVCAFGRDLADDRALAHHDDAVRERAYLVEVVRYQHDARAGVAHRAQPLIDRQGRADVHTPCRSEDEHHFRVSAQCATDNQLWLVASGVGGPLSRCVKRREAMRARDGVRAFRSPACVKQEAARGAPLITE